MNVDNVTVAPLKLVVALEAVRLPIVKFPSKVCVPLVLIMVPTAPATAFVVPVTNSAFVPIDKVAPA
jgi:hypothetical protein